MSKIVPVNSFIEIVPIKVEGFISTSDDKFAERGQVVGKDPAVAIASIGDIVYFDSWLATKYPDAEGNIHFFVKEDNITAIEYVSDSISK